MAGVGDFPLVSVSGVIRDTNGSQRQTLADAKAAQRYTNTALQDVKKRTLESFREPGTTSPAVTKLEAKIEGLQKIAQQQSGKDKERADAKITKAREQLDYLKQDIDPAAAAADSYVPRVGGGRTRADRGPNAEQKQADYDAKNEALDAQPLSAKAA